MTDWIARVCTSRRVCGLVARWGRAGTVSQGPGDTNSFALTFDDGPDPAWTPQVLGVLSELGVKATFFVLGDGAAAYPHLVKMAASQGHTIGTHLYSHSRLPVRGGQQFAHELRRSLAVIEPLTDRPVQFVRFPFGYRGRQKPAQLADRGLVAVHWTFSSHDSFLRDPGRITRRVSELLRPGAIVLMHDGLRIEDPTSKRYREDRRATIQALPDIVAFARKSGLEPATLDEMLCSAVTSAQSAR